MGLIEKHGKHRAGTATRATPRAFSSTLDDATNGAAALQPSRRPKPVAVRRAAQERMRSHSLITSAV